MTTIEVVALLTPAILFAVCGLGVWWQLRH